MKQSLRYVVFGMLTMAAYVVVIYAFTTGVYMLYYEIEHSGEPKIERQNYLLERKE